ncbi:DUF1801 domain-containing protein [Marinicellulosiphila megalodicopiae]|uniref:DUF1801 domain-containing protein n=1 Tax=Marinicellulosiphila megalodicopiae TaxID=2724896 RepID=UPI003BB0C7E9
MTTHKHPEVDNFLIHSTKWTDELSALREILLECDVEETYKWRQPCYTVNQKNSFILGGFKDFCVLSFFKGVQLKDKHKKLSRAGEHTQSARIYKFTNVQQILDDSKIIKHYILEAIEIEKSGMTDEPKPKVQYELIDELKEMFEALPELETAFYKLTPGRQRGYHLHFSGAKQSKTRTSRIEKCYDKIMDGFGFNDCNCGLSKRKPNCDGSHKALL